MNEQYPNMCSEIIDTIDVEKRFSDLGLKSPEGFCILPRRFESAKTVSDLCHESSALDLKTLFQQAGVPVTVYQPDGTQIPYIKENDNTWIGPVLFFSTAAIIQNPHIISVALSVIANYVTDIFKRSPESSRVKLSLFSETHTTKTTTKTTKKVEIDCSSDKFSEIIAAYLKDNK